MSGNVYRLCSPKSNVQINVSGKMYTAAVAVFGYTPQQTGTGTTNPNGRFEALLRNWTAVWDRTAVPSHVIIGNRDAATGKITIPVGAMILHSDGTKFFIDDNWGGQKICGHVRMVQSDGSYLCDGMPGMG